MPVFVNVHGKIRELYRVFFNDNGVIREVESLHAQNDNNEIKELFGHKMYLPEVISWVAYNGNDNLDSSTVNSVTNNGYTINAYITDKKRSVATKNKIFLIAGTKIRVEFSNTVYDTDEEIITTGNIIYLFSTESTSDYVQDKASLSSSNTMSSNTMTVTSEGRYYIALSMYGKDTSGKVHYCTTDASIYILYPN